MSQWGSTTRVRAVVTMAGGGTYPGHLHLQDGVHGYGRPETPLEMVNRPDGFFPLTLGDGAVFLASRAQVVMVACEWPPEELEELGVEGRRIRLEVRLASGEMVSGETVAHLPTGQARVLDYLNRVAPFFQVNTEGGTRLINRAHVQVVRPLD